MKMHCDDHHLMMRNNKVHMKHKGGDRWCCAQPCKVIWHQRVLQTGGPSVGEGFKQVILAGPDELTMGHLFHAIQADLARGPVPWLLDPRTPSTLFHSCFHSLL